MFSSDTPIQTSKDDLLDRGTFAQKLAQALLGIQTSDTFTVGLYGPWGSGKTSLLNMVLDEIKNQQRDLPTEEQVTVFCFEPWNVSDTSQIFRQFFLQLSEKFKSNAVQKSSKLGEALESYADAFELVSLIPAVGTPLAVVGKRVVSRLGKRLKENGEQADIQKQKEQVIDILREKSQKILIVIDDIDRLNNEQIRQVFQLIAAVANFPNTIYMVLFDRDIVVGALNQMQAGSGEDYLEKIIQMPIALPDIQCEKIHTILFGYIKNIVDQSKNISLDEDYWQKLLPVCIDPFIKNLRDIKRLYNSLQFKLAGIGEEVNFVDMAAISALELTLPQIYQWVKKNKGVLTGGADIQNGLWGSNQKPSHSDNYAAYESELRALLNRDQTDKFSPEMVLVCLSKLFPCFGEKIGKNYEAIDKDAWRRQNRIAHPDKFDRYFSLDIDDIGIRRRKVLNTLNSLDSKGISEYIRDCDKEGTSYELLEEIRVLMPMISPERVKTLVEGIANVAAELGYVTGNAIFSRSASLLARSILLDLIEMMDEADRFPFLSEMVRNANPTVFSSMASVWNLLELVYGRLGADGVEREYKKVLSLEELQQWETVFIQKASILLAENNLFDIPDWRRPFFLLQYFSPKYINEYLATAFQEDTNIVKYLEVPVVEWIGGSIRYEVQNTYQKYLVEDQILQAIRAVKNSGELFSLPETIQRKSGAFYLNYQGKEKYADGIPQMEADALLTKWKQEGNVPGSASCDFR